MKKIIALLLTITLLFTLSLTAFAAKSPEAAQKVTVVLRKGDGIKGALESDVKYTLDGGAEVSVVANEKEYGKFAGWSIYKVVGEGKTEPANMPGDYEIIKGGANLHELSILAHTDLIICANYGDTITDPLSQSSTSGTDTDESPQTGDMMALYAFIAILACVAVMVGVKKQFAK